MVVDFVQAAALLSVTVEEVAALVAAGRLAVVLRGRARFLQAREVTELVEELRVERARARNTLRSTALLEAAQVAEVMQTDLPTVLGWVGRGLLAPVAFDEGVPLFHARDVFAVLDRPE